MKGRYIGITLGPLNSTIALAGSPAGLWAASYLFSYLADTLCRLLVEQGVPPEAFVVPYYDPEDPLMQAHREAGLYHDRILFRAGDLPIEALDDLRRRAVAETARAFYTDETYLSRYLLVEAAAFEAENPVAESEAILNSLELSPPFVAEQTGNPLITLFTTNRLLRTTPLMKTVGNRQLMRPDGGYKDTTQLVAVGDTPARYYAMVRADGDATGRVLRSLSGDEEIRAFSRACLSYCAAVSDLVREHGGFTVYAGGDDLLALLPCVDGRGRPLPHFLQAASRLYKEAFAGYSARASISFGVTIGRCNAPVHEMLESSADLLFVQAKRLHDTVALHVTGRRNGADGLLIGTAALPTLCRLLGEDTPRYVLLACTATLRRYAAVFATVTRPEEIYRALNRYVESYQGEEPFLRRTLPELLCSLHEGLPVYAIKGDGRGDPVEAACYLLDLLAFFTERGEGQ